MRNLPKQNHFSLSLAGPRSPQRYNRTGGTTTGGQPGRDCRHCSLTTETIAPLEIPRLGAPFSVPRKKIADSNPICTYLA